MTLKSFHYTQMNKTRSILKNRRITKRVLQISDIFPKLYASHYTSQGIFQQLPEFSLFFKLRPEICSAVWRTWQLIPCSNGSWFNYQFSVYLNHSYLFFMNGGENWASRYCLVIMRIEKLAICRQNLLRQFLEWYDDILWNMLCTEAVSVYTSFIL